MNSGENFERPKAWDRMRIYHDVAMEVSGNGLLDDGLQCCSGAHGMCCFLRRASPGSDAVNMAEWFPELDLMKPVERSYWQHWLPDGDWETRATVLLFCRELADDEWQRVLDAAMSTIAFGG